MEDGEQADDTQPEPLVSWRFRDRASGSWLDDTGHGLSLRDGPGSGVRPIVDETVGDCIEFDGVKDFLTIPGSETRVLDSARSTGQVTVMALIRRRGIDTGFIAGMWQESAADPRRTYGLFVSLPTYGGAQQVVGHVSADGRPSPGLPYSRDYSASARMIPVDQWRVIGFTYDGSAITSYLDGVADPRPAFTECGHPLGEGRTYAKNPYLFPLGLRQGRVSDFTVGAVLLDSGMGNLFAGRIARLAVWSSALSAEQMMTEARRWTPQNAPTLRFDFHRPAYDVPYHAGGWHGPCWPASAIGWRRWVGDRAHDASEVAEGLCISRAGLTWSASTVRRQSELVAFTGIRGLRCDDMGEITLRAVARDATPFRFAICVDAVWWVTAELRGQVAVRTFSISGSVWQRLVLSDRVPLRVIQRRHRNLPPGDVSGAGIYLDGGDSLGALSISELHLGTVR